MSYEIKFYLDQRTDPETGKLQSKDIPVRFSFVFDKQRFMSTTGLKANSNQWSKEKQCFKNGSTNYIEKNNSLKDIRERLEKIYLDNSTGGIQPTVDIIRDAYRSKSNTKNFIQYFDEFTTTAGAVNAWSLSTYQKFKTLKIHLQNFEKQNGQLDFQKINNGFYQNLFTYFVQIEHRNSTIKKTFRNLNWFLGWVEKTKKISIPGLKDFEFKDKVASTKNNPENIIFLKPDEFLLMYEAVIPDLRLTRVRDAFLFMCATGLRYSDYAALKPENFTENSVKMTTVKTSDTIDIPLNPFSKSILEKYNYELPKYSNQRLNNYIKELGRYLNLDRRLTNVYIKAGKIVKEESPLYDVLTCHCARRTFISLSIFLNMNSEILMQFSGHHSHETLKIYMGITPEQKRREMLLFTPENLKTKIAQ